MSIRVLHVTEDFSHSNTGVTSVVHQLSAWQVEHCEWVGVYASGRSNLAPPKGVYITETDLVEWSGAWRYPRGGAYKLVDTIKANRINLVHIHGLWRASSLLAAKAAQKADVPIILSVHGQTSLWALKAQGLLKTVKKKLYWNALGRKWLGKVSCLHAITPIEQEDMARFFNCALPTVIPNAVSQINQEDACKTPKNYFVFLGRIHPVKGIDRLIDAFLASSIASDWKLIIAGPEEINDYAKNLKEKAKGSDRIKFIGPVYGADKIRLLKNAWALVAPSFTEVIGMVNLEAGSLSTPSLTTSETGLLDWESGGGVLVTNDVADLQAALEHAASWTLEERLARGMRSKMLVDSRYQLDVIGHQWLSFYKDVLSKAIA